MVIVFYDANDEKFYIASPDIGMKVIRYDDAELMNYFPNDDILYVTNGHYFTKQQFEDWLSGDMEIDEPDDEPSRWDGFLEDDVESKSQKKPTKKSQKSKSNRRYIHPTANGTVLIEDIDTPQFPGGVALNGKWHFIAVDDIGVENLSNSAHFRLFVKRGKIEVVDEKYVKRHQHKINNKKSPAEQALDRILIKDGTHGTAERVASSGGLAANMSDDIAVPIIVD